MRVTGRRIVVSYDIEYDLNEGPDEVYKCLGTLAVDWRVLRNTPIINPRKDQKGKGLMVIEVELGE